MLHTLLHVAQWPCVPSGVTSTFAPQSSHFGLAIILKQTICSVRRDIVEKGLEALRRDDTIHPCNVRHHDQQHAHNMCKQGAGREELRHHSLAIVHLSNPLAGGLLRLVIALATSTCTAPAGTRSYLPLMMAKQRFRYPTPQGALHIL